MCLVLSGAHNERSWFCRLCYDNIIKFVYTCVCVVVEEVAKQDIVCAYYCASLVDKTAPNVAFEYGGDRNGDDSLKEIEVEEKQQLFDSTITAPLTR